MSAELLRRALFLPEQASTFAPRVDLLHALIIGTTLSLGAIVLATFVYFTVRFRRRNEAEVTPRFELPLAVEGLFAGGILTLFLGWFFVGFTDYVWAVSPPANAMDVYVTAKQWMWTFTLPDGTSGINTLRVPAQRPVRLLLTSRDVIHSFYVPDFRIKQDAVPGRYTQTWFEAPSEGRHLVLCAEYCGLEHSQMRAEVMVMAPDAYDEWVARQRQKLHAGQQGVRDSAPKDPSTLAAAGQRVASERGCLKCHTVDGTPHIGPTWVDLYLRRERLEGGEEIVADEAYLTESMMDPQARIVAGYAPVMPSFRGQLSPAETGALVEYIRSLKSDRVRPIPSEEPAYEPIPGR